ncbi:MAG TPA: serine hydrolase domain-containing protein, partial [Micromonosporaceae bacterium]
GDRITVRRLLDHTAGLYNYTNDWMDENGVNLPALLASGARPIPPAEVVAGAVARPVNFAPGESLAYDNTGYLLAGMVVEAAGGRAYEDHITDRILRPLGLNQTVVRMSSELPEPHAHGYLMQHDLTTFDRTAAGSAGGIVSTAGDVNRFFAGLLRGDLLGAAELTEMLAPTPWRDPAFRAGLGMIGMTLDGGVDVIGKDGDFLGYDTWSFHTFAGDRQLTLSVTTSCDISFDTAQILARFGYVLL